MAPATIAARAAASSSSMRKLSTPILFPALLWLLLSASPAAAGALVTNGFFETGDFTGWTLFTTPNGRIGPLFPPPSAPEVPRVTFFDTDGDGVRSRAAQFQVGVETFSGPDTPGAGGGIVQEFRVEAGSLEVAADVAVTGSGNSQGGLFELLIDGEVLDRVAFGFTGIAGVHRGSLAAALEVAAGVHELRIRVTRRLTTIGGTTPFQYIDNVRLTSNGVSDPVPDPVPEPPPPPAPVVRDGQSKIYWADTQLNRIQKSNLDGSQVETLVTGVSGAFGLAIDAAAGLMYWTDLGIEAVAGDSTIRRARIDGSGIEVVLSAADGVRHPSDLELDPVHRKLYWADAGDAAVGGRIYRAGLDGSNVELLVDVRSLRAAAPSGADTLEFSQVWGIALDVARDALYWSDYVGDDIHRATLGGADPVRLVPGTGSYRGVAIDAAGGWMYWTTGQAGDDVRRARLDGSGETVIAGASSALVLKQPFQVALDREAGHVYWSDLDAGTIDRAGLDGSDPVVVVEVVRQRRDRVRPSSVGALALNLVDSTLTLFRRGDANADASVDISDALAILDFLFGAGASPPCAAAADANGDGAVDLSDAIRTLLHLFAAGVDIPAPGPETCGVDPAADGLACERFDPCAAAP